MRTTTVVRGGVLTVIVKLPVLGLLFLLGCGSGGGKGDGGLQLQDDMGADMAHADLRQPAGDMATAPDLAQPVPDMARLVCNGVPCQPGENCTAVKNNQDRLSMVQCSSYCPTVCCNVHLADPQWTCLYTGSCGTTVCN